MRKLFISILALSLGAVAQVPASDPVPRSDTKETKQRRQAAKGEESSSRENIIDLAPPKREKLDKDAAADNLEIAPAEGVNEMTPWNPHKAMKAVEVGDFYYRDKKYTAAISRYREALDFKPRDAEATFKLARALEKFGASGEALFRYEEYLKILKNGDYAEECRKAAARLRAKGVEPEPYVPRPEGPVKHGRILELPTSRP
jgi:tetratricopeptide (TPR) repeat protein